MNERIVIFKDYTTSGYWWFASRDEQDNEIRLLYRSESLHLYSSGA